jgi:hypothetical protein
MTNEEVLKKLLDTLKDDLDFYNDLLKELAVDIMAEGFSKFPVFVAHQHEVKLGEMVLDHKEYARDYSINATTIEELLEKKLIAADKENDFKQTYKDPRKFMCILFVRPDGANFIFMPYKKNNNRKDEE